MATVSNHATVLVYSQDPSTSTYDIFIGQETTYYVDRASGSSMFPRSATDTNSTILRDPILAANPSYTFVRREHIRTDGSISTKFTIQYTTARSDWGLPKGKQESVDATTLDTGKREFWEEVGYNLETAKFGAPTQLTAIFKGRPAYSDLYMVEVDAVEKQKITEAYENKMCTRKGELHNGTFMGFAAAKRLSTNQFTTEAFKKFAAAKGIAYPGGGGRRKSRRTRRHQRK